jgi:predicted AlkP superfamily phosphohydrolase/phosphomutase
MVPPAKLAFIAFDASDWPLIEQLSAEGELPCFARLIASSARVQIDSPIALGSDVMWFSFFTGVNPGRHGRYFVTQVRPGSYNSTKYLPEDAGRPPFWTAVGAAGHRIAIIDVPYAPLGRNFNGLQITDWLVHNMIYGHPQSWPLEAIGEIQGKYGADPVGGCDLPERTDAQYGLLRDLLVKRVHKKSKMICDTLDQGDWGLFMAAFAESHCVGHQCWHLHDPDHPLHDTKWTRRYGDPVLDVYRELDAALGSVLEAAGPEAKVLVFVGPGMTRNYTGNHLLDEILERLEGGSAVNRAAALRRLRTFYHRFAPRAVRQQMSGLAASSHETLQARTRASRGCFAVPHNEISGAIRVNLVDREPNGRVQTGAAYDAFFSQLKQDLLDIVDLETGRQVIDAVYRSDDLYTGDRVDELPDILVLWNRAAPNNAIGSPKIGEIRRSYPGNRTGDHTATSVLFIRGPEVRAGAVDLPMSIVDFAPTMASEFDVRLPDIDGQPLPLFGE